MTRAERATAARAQACDDARWVHLPGRHGPLRARLFELAAARGLFLHLHGGGWVFGSADQQDALLDQVRHAAQVNVLSLEYRLAPEHPYPAALHDAQDALCSLIEQPHLLPGAHRIVVGGESAGACLAAAALSALRGHARFAAIKGVSFHYGTFDLLRATPGGQEQLPFLDETLIRWFAQQYATPAQWREPGVSPLFDHWQGMPRALFLAGSADPVMDDSRRLHARWLEAGSQAQLALLPGGLHGMLELRTPLTAAARRVVSSFITDCLVHRQEDGTPGR